MLIDGYGWTKRKVCKWPYVFSLIFLLPAQAHAWDWAVTTSVNSIEASYMPGGVVFTAKDNAGSCAAGNLLAWNVRYSASDDRIANASSIYALLLTALSTGKSITIYGNNNGCTVDHVYINSN